jgi:hypothetical protein
MANSCPACVTIEYLLKGKLWGEIYYLNYRRMPGQVHSLQPSILDDSID